jgi:hypothetical protein
MSVSFQYILIFAATLLASMATAKEQVGEAKVYSAPGALHVTNIEIFEPVAGALFDVLNAPSTSTAEGGLRFEQKTAGILTCTRKLENGKVSSHFCVMHMLGDGTLLPGTVANFDNSDESSEAFLSGHGEIRVDTRGKQLRGTLNISAQAAHALFSALQTQSVAGHKKGSGLECSESGANYQCAISMHPTQAPAERVVSKVQKSREAAAAGAIGG